MWLPFTRQSALRLPFNNERQDVSGPDKNDASNSGKKDDGKQFKAGVAVGIGSAALVAALLYARSGKPKKK
jgi:hypothetical protein